MNQFARIKDLIPNKIFQRYLASNFIVPFAMSLTFFVAFLLTTQLFRFMRVVTKKGVSVEAIASSYDGAYDAALERATDLLGL